MVKNSVSGVDANDTRISINKLDHVSIAVPNLAEAIELFTSNFQCKASSPKEIPEQGVRIAYINMGMSKLELMEPLAGSSPIAKFLDRHPMGGIHHLCLSTPDIDSALQKLKDSKIKVLGKEPPQPGHHGKKIVFTNPKDTLGSLLEIEEVQS
ncbi:MAG: methylmalonyl-CoA epimerase [Pseudomonadota bacterium]|nr:methylmalonyl-CoA epimerase [Pseudomonadota bacterium]